MKIKQYIKIEGELFTYDKYKGKKFIVFTPAELKRLIKYLKGAK